MKYLAKYFTVPASSANVPVDCQHGWVNHRKRCVLCGELVAANWLEIDITITYAEL